MLQVHIPSAGPEAGAPRQSPEKSHVVFRVEVRCRGRRHAVPRRYSEFQALHKRIKKLYKVPDFPSKRLPNWRTRGLEQRRQGLEAYIQGILYLNQDVPKELLEFLSLGTSRQTQRPVGGHSCNTGLHSVSAWIPYICIPSPEPLPNMVVNGVLQGFYGLSTNTADTQPAAPCHSAPLPLIPFPSQRPLDHMPGQSFASVL